VHDTVPPGGGSFLKAAQALIDAASVRLAAATTTPGWPGSPKTDRRRAGFKAVSLWSPRRPQRGDAVIGEAAVWVDGAQDASAEAADLFKRLVRWPSPRPSPAR
jgi:hypothetical protein